MNTITRRGFLQGAIALPIVLSLPRQATAQTGLVCRHDIASPTGAEMTAIYAQAVATMQAMGPENPMSWMWQWYTHFVNGATTKTAELDRIFGMETSPLRTLAEETWNTCQSHAGQNANNFLPWHRMFVYYFENIVRQVSGRPDFTLPYWDYTSPDPAKRGIVPVQFRLPTDPLYKSLFRADRTLLARTGQPIHKNVAADVMNIDDLMLKTDYGPVGKVQGFCRTLDSGIHSRIHALVGTALNMGKVPYAGRDPLFWVHHANVDRMWASWNLAGKPNPVPTLAWTKKLFVFADANGVRQQRPLNEFFDTAALGYTYDNFIGQPVPEPLPPPPPPEGAALIAGTMTDSVAAVDSTAAPGRVVIPVARGKGPARLATGAVQVPLVALPGSRAESHLGLDLARPDLRTYLVLSELHAWAQPEVLYEVYLVRGKAQGRRARQYAGVISFFDAEFHDHGQGEAQLNEALGENFYSFDVTAALRRMARGAARKEKALSVEFRPAGVPTAGADPVVATIELVRQ